MSRASESRCKPRLRFPTDPRPRRIRRRRGGACLLCLKTASKDCCLPFALLLDLACLGNFDHCQETEPKASVTPQVSFAITNVSGSDSTTVSSNGKASDEKGALRPDLCRSGWPTRHRWTTQDVTAAPRNSSDAVCNREGPWDHRAEEDKRAI